MFSTVFVSSYLNNKHTKKMHVLPSNHATAGVTMLPGDVGRLEKTQNHIDFKKKPLKDHFTDFIEGANEKRFEVC